MSISGHFEKIPARVERKPGGLYVQVDDALEIRIESVRKTTFGHVVVVKGRTLTDKSTPWETVEVRPGDSIRFSFSYAPEVSS